MSEVGARLVLEELPVSGCTFSGHSPEVVSLCSKGFPLGSQVGVIAYPWPVLLLVSLTPVPVPLTGPLFWMLRKNWIQKGVAALWCR